MKTLNPIILAGLAIAMTVTPARSVSETGLKESVRSSAAAAKDAIQHIGNDGKELGRGLAMAAKDTGHAIGRAARSAANDVSTGFRRDFIEGGVLKGPRPAQPAPTLGSAP